MVNFWSNRFNNFTSSSSSKDIELKLERILDILLKNFV